MEGIRLENETKKKEIRACVEFSIKHNGEKKEREIERRRMEKLERVKLAKERLEIKEHIDNLKRVAKAEKEEEDAVYREKISKEKEKINNTQRQQNALENIRSEREEKRMRFLEEKRKVIEDLLTDESRRKDTELKGRQRQRREEADAAMGRIRMGNFDYHGR